MSDLDAMLKRAAQHKMTPAEQHAQRRSWMIGQMLCSHPEMTREEAERLADRAVGPNLAARVAELEAENARLRIALHDAIRRPMGVTPDSAAEFYSQRMADEAEARRQRMGGGDVG